MLSKTSEAISLPSEPGKAPIGASTGNGGAVSRPTIASDEARAWLDKREPAQTDADLKTSLQSSLGVTLWTTREWRFPEGRPAYSVTTTTGARGPSKANIERATQRVEAAMTPTTRRTAEEMVAQLSAALATRSTTGAMNEVKLDLYVECLLRHPADVVRAVVRDLAFEPRPGGGTAWFPTLPELEGACRQMTGERLSMLQGLRNWREPEPVDEALVALERASMEAHEAARQATLKVGPGPATDTGERGDRIEAERLAMIAAREAKEALHAYLK